MPLKKHIQSICFTHHHAKCKRTKGISPFCLSNGKVAKLLNDEGIVKTYCVPASSFGAAGTAGLPQVGAARSLFFQKLCISDVIVSVFIIETMVYFYMATSK